MAKRLELTEAWPGFPKGTILVQGRDGDYYSPPDKDGAVLSLRPEAVEEHVEGGSKLRQPAFIGEKITSMKRIADG